MQAQPQKEHEWLQQLVGNWTYEHDCDNGPGQPRSRLTGTQRVRSLGGLWIIAEGRGEMPGGGIAETILTLGYDPQKQRFVGTFVGSMMTNLWLYDGFLEGNKLTLPCEGPSFTDPKKLVMYRDVIELISRDEHTLNSYAQAPDGEWQHFMSATYRRSG
jgi:hypothetical protein